MPRSRPKQSGTAPRAQSSGSAVEQPVPAPPPVPAEETCDVCGSTDLVEIRCKVICRNCRTILRTCSDL